MTTDSRSPRPQMVTDIKAFSVMAADKTPSLAEEGFKGVVGVPLAATVSETVGYGSCGFTRAALERLCRKSLPKGQQIDPLCYPRLALVIESVIGSALHLGIEAADHKRLIPSDIDRGIGLVHSAWASENLGSTLEDVASIMGRLNHIQKLLGGKP